MCCSAWLNRGTVVGLLVGLILGGGASAARFQLRKQPKETTNTEPAKPGPTSEPPKQEPNAANSAAQKEKAYLACQSLAQACEAYHYNAENVDGSYPQSFEKLIQPPFGGPSFLKHGKEDTIDPWGQTYKLELRDRQDGTLSAMIFTHAPDGALITQFGIGVKAWPK